VGVGVGVGVGEGVGVSVGVGVGVGVGVRVGPRCGAAGCMLRSAPEGGCICARARRIRVLPSSL